MPKKLCGVKTALLTLAIKVTFECCIQSVDCCTLPYALLVSNRGI